MVQIKLIHLEPKNNFVQYRYDERNAPHTHRYRLPSYRNQRVLMISTIKPQGECYKYNLQGFWYVPTNKNHRSLCTGSINNIFGNMPEVIYLQYI